MEPNVGRSWNLGFAFALAFAFVYTCDSFYLQQDPFISIASQVPLHAVIGIAYDRSPGLWLCSPLMGICWTARVSLSLHVGDSVGSYGAVQ